MTWIIENRQLIKLLQEPTFSIQQSTTKHIIWNLEKYILCLFVISAIYINDKKYKTRTILVLELSRNIEDRFWLCTVYMELSGNVRKLINNKTQLYICIYLPPRFTIIMFYFKSLRLHLSIYKVKYTIQFCK